MLDFRALQWALTAAALVAAPGVFAFPGYVVNSDDPSPSNFDALHTIDFLSRQATKVGEVRRASNAPPYADVEGLAFSPDGVLYGIDDATNTLLIIDQSTGIAQPVNGSEGNTGLPRTVNFDFGLTFDCQGVLYASSDSRRTLYRLDRNTGVATVVGSEGALGAQITGLAARYDGVYGIGSSGDENLYRINTNNGTATLIGPLGAGLRFTDGGLDFDAQGGLWGIADMTGETLTPVPSILFRIDVNTGAAVVMGNILSGVESLAIAPPPCSAPQGPALPPAIPTMDRSGLLGLILALLLSGWWARRFTSA